MNESGSSPLDESVRMGGSSPDPEGAALGPDVTLGGVPGGPPARVAGVPSARLWPWGQVAVGQQREGWTSAARVMLLASVTSNATAMPYAAAERPQAAYRQQQLTTKAGGMMTGEGLPVTVLAAPASAREVSRGEGVAPSTRNPTTLTGGDVFESCFFMAPGDATQAPGVWWQGGGSRGWGCEQAAAAGRRQRRGARKLDGWRGRRTIMILALEAEAQSRRRPHQE